VQSPTHSAALTDLPLQTALLRLAIPLTGTMALETAFNFVNGYWVGRLGTSSLAAVNMCSFSIWMMMALTGTISTGSNAVISRSVGARRHEESRAVAWLSVVAALIWGAFLSLLASHYAQPYLRWQAGQLGDLESVVQAATLYLQTIFLFAPIFCLNEVLAAILRAQSDAVTPLKVYTFGVLLNFALDPIFMFGWGPFPKMGLAGAAYASGLSFALMATLLLALVGYRMGWALPRVRALGEILRIGFPSSITGAFFCFIYILITPTVAAYGPSALAALGVGHRVESFSYLVSHGLALASITLVGQHLGAGNPKQAFRAAWEACRLVSYFMLLSTVVLVAGAEPLARVFSDDPEVVERATLYLQWMSLAQWATGLAVVLEGVMAGAGRPLLTMVVSTSSAASRWPATTWGSKAWGLSGIWSALVIARWIEAFLCIVVFLKSSVWRSAIDRKGQDSL